jgi:hypothetical protein
MDARSYRRTVEYVYGESTKDQIWISSTAPMSFEELLTILIHEALHDAVLVDGEFLTCHQEHQCMFLLGDRTYW